MRGIVRLGWTRNGTLLGKAADCAKRIFELDANSSRGNALLGMVQFHSGALRAALEPLERALRANPTDPDTLGTLGYLYALIGRNEQGPASICRVPGNRPSHPY